MEMYLVFRTGNIGSVREMYDRGDRNSRQDILSLVLKVLASIDEYEEYAKKIPNEFKEDFNFDVKGLEIKISYLQRDYLKD